MGHRPLTSLPPTTSKNLWVADVTVIPVRTPGASLPLFTSAVIPSPLSLPLSQLLPPHAITVTHVKGSGVGQQIHKDTALISLVAL